MFTLSTLALFQVSTASFFFHNGKKNAVETGNEASHLHYYNSRYYHISLYFLKRLSACMCTSLDPQKEGDLFKE